MEHFYNTIDGWFNYISIYSYVIDNVEDNDHLVEVGAWKGKSTSFLAVGLANSGKKVKFDVVDTWAGSLEHQDNELVKADALYEHFLDNMKPVEGYYNPRRMTSLEAAATYEDNSLDFVLVDGSHEYNQVHKDISQWLKKVKSGGMIAGDDYDWPGVEQAVRELLPTANIITSLSNGFPCWLYIKE
jgi:predicted O-methyltransferase YrrM